MNNVWTERRITDADYFKCLANDKSSTCIRMEKEKELLGNHIIISNLNRMQILEQL